MVDGIIALVICYFVKEWSQPCVEVFVQYKISQGYPLESIQSGLSLMELVMQIVAFIIVYTIINIAKYFMFKH